MRRKRLSPVEVLTLCDVGMVAMSSGGLLWRWASERLPLWLNLLLLAAVFILHRRYKRRFIALTRLARRISRSLPLSERRVRYQWVCGQFVVAALLIAWAIPFAFSTAAFWCIYTVVLIVLVALLDASRQHLLREERSAESGLTL